MYDYGSPAKNAAAYNGSTSPPRYDLSKFQRPLALFTGGNDYLADPKDVTRLESELPAGILVKRVDEPTFAHLDFTVSFRAKRERRKTSLQRHSPRYLSHARVARMG